jgi:enterochelin esterase-like enzyme
MSKSNFICACPLLFALTACSGEAAPEPSASGGVAGSGGGGAAAVGGAGQPSSGGNQAGMSVGGDVTNGGSGGGGGSITAGAGGASGSGGSGGSMPGCEELGTPGKNGRQCDPGTDGDGTFDQMQPPSQYPPEAQGNPEGVLSGGKQLQSKVYGYGFNYRVYKPVAYQAGKPAALMIFQDGGNYTNNFHAPRVFDSLIKEGSVPVIISVYVDPAQNRSKEYDTRDAKYGTMLTTELIPELAKDFDLVDDPNGWAIGGHSSGGSCAFNVAWQFPTKFHKVVTHSGSFVNLQNPGDADYINLVKMTTPLMPIRVTLLSGTNDLAAPTWFNANNNMAASLMTAGYHYRYEKSTTQHGPTMWHFNDFPPALRWLWKGYTLPQYPTVK